MNEYEILLIWDDEARVWIAQNDDIPLVLENGSVDLLMEQVRLVAPEGAYPIFCVNGKISLERNPLFSELNRELV